MVCREREDHRAAARAEEAEAEGRLRALHAHVLELRRYFCFVASARAQHSEARRLH